MADYGYNPEKNQWLAAQTGYTGDFGAGQFGTWAQQQGLDTGTLEQMYSNQPLPQQEAPAPQEYQGPSAQDIGQTTYSFMDPRFTGLEQGQSQLGQGQAALAGNQGAIMQNQATIQGDIGTVGQGVAGVQGAIGAPAEEGQTVFGQLGSQGQAIAGLGNQFGNLSGQFDQFGNQLGDFQSMYENRSGQTLSNLSDVREQGLKGRADLERQMQDMQPMAYQTNQGVQSLLSSPMMQSPMAPSAGGSALAPSAQADASTNLNQAASNMVMGPTGPMMPDPRDAYL